MKRTSNPMGAASLAILRTLQTYGMQTIREMERLCAAADGHRVAHLVTSGYVASNTKTSPATYSLTAKGYHKITGSPKPQPSKAMGPRADWRYAPRYEAQEFAPSMRPGAMDFLALPSRFSNRLHFRDGRVEGVES